jgi:hypothetical protein
MRSPLTLRLAGRGLEPGAVDVRRTRAYDISWICWRQRGSSDPSPYGPIGDPYVDGGDTKGIATTPVTAVVGLDGTVSVSMPLRETQPSCPVDYPNLGSTDGRWSDARIDVSPPELVLATDFLEEWLI